MTLALPAPRAILFDLDGTLADTAPDLGGAINRVRVARGLKPTPYEQLRPVASAGARGLIGASFGLQPGDADYEVLRSEFLAAYEKDIALETRLFDGVPELIARLESLGIAWGIVTNKAARLTDRLTPLIGLGGAACTISGDTTPYSKPHPAPLLEAAKRISLRPDQCWYVGDDLRDIQAGKSAGMATFAAAWGYCGHVEPSTWNAEAVVEHPLALLEFI